MLDTLSHAVPRQLPLDASRAAQVGRWLMIRLVVGAVCVASLLGMAQLTIQLLIAVYANIPPYSGVS